MKKHFLTLAIVAGVTMLWSSCKDEDSKDGDIINNTTIVSEESNPLLGTWAEEGTPSSVTKYYIEFTKDMEILLNYEDSLGIGLSVSEGSYEYIGNNTIMIINAGSSMPDYISFDFSADSSAIYIWTLGDNPTTAERYDKYTGDRIDPVEEAAVSAVYSLPSHVEFSNFNTFSAKGNNWVIPAVNDNMLYTFNINSKSFTDSADVAPTYYNSIVKGTTSLFATTQGLRTLFEINNDGVLQGTSAMASSTLNNVLDGSSGLEALISGRQIHSTDGTDFTLEFTLESAFSFNTALYVNGSYLFIFDNYLVEVNTNPISVNKVYSIPAGYNVLGYASNGTDIYFLGSDKFGQDQMIYQVTLN